MKYLKDIKIGDLMKYAAILIFQGIWVGVIYLTMIALDLDTYYWEWWNWVLYFPGTAIISNIICGIAIEAIKKRISFRKEGA